MNTILSITLFGEGFVTGIMLTMMLGPVTMIILRYGLQINRIAGLWAAIGTWVSDFIFITLTFWMTISIDQWSKRPDIRLALFIAGGLGLLVMGLLMLRVKNGTFNGDDNKVKSGYLRAFIGGFLVNSLSPFTLFFWLGIAVFLHMEENGNPIWYYVGVMLSLGIGDFTKAWIAPKLSLWINDKYVYWIQVTAGILIALTGLYILYKGIME